MHNTKRITINYEIGHQNQERKTVRQLAKLFPYNGKIQVRK